MRRSMKVGNERWETVLHQHLRSAGEDEAKTEFPARWPGASGCQAGQGERQARKDGPCAPPPPAPPQGDRAQGAAPCAPASLPPWSLAPASPAAGLASEASGSLSGAGAGALHLSPPIFPVPLSQPLPALDGSSAPSAPILAPPPSSLGCARASISASSPCRRPHRSPPPPVACPRPAALGGRAAAEEGVRASGGGGGGTGGRCWGRRGGWRGAS